MKKIIIAILIFLSFYNIAYSAQPKINDAQVGLSVYNKSAPSTIYKSSMHDGEYTGEVLIDTMAASSDLYKALYLSPSGWNKAIASSIEVNLPCLGICVETGTGDRKILTKGYIKNNSWDFSAKGLLYLSPITSGEITIAKPTAVGQIIQVLGLALGSDEIYFNPSTTYIEIGE